MCIMNVLYCQMLTLSSYPKEVPVKGTVFKKTKTCASLAFHSALTGRRHAAWGEQRGSEFSICRLGCHRPHLQRQPSRQPMVEQVKVDLNLGLNE